MKKWIRLIASLKLTVGLLVVLGVALAGGTIVESRHGTAVAQAAVYTAGWFKLLLAVFGINLLAALIDRWPWGRFRIGFALTHLSMVVILAGALVTDQLKVEGQLALWEGQESSTYVTPDEGQGELPFSVQLEDFQIDVYPGTQRPAMFRSRVVVTDPATGESFPAAIEMNKELTYAGYSLFQSSYQQAQGRERTILSVSKDPGQLIVFIGYVLLVVGMITVLATRITQQRMLGGAVPLGPAPGGGGAKARGKARGKGAAAVLLATALTAAWAAAPAAAVEILGGETVEALRRVPVQHDGRTMPLDTLAREASRAVTGYQELGWIDPVALVVGWSLEPEAWAAEPVVKVGGPELAETAGLAPGTRFASFQRLVGSQALLNLMQSARGRAQREEPLTPLEDDAKDLEGRLLWLQSFLNRQAIRMIPHPEDPIAEWAPPPSFESAQALLDLQAQTRAAAPAHYPSEKAMEREVTYNRVRSSRLAWWVLVPAALVALVAWLKDRRGVGVAAAALLTAGFAVMTWGLATRWAIAGRIPASNMYESMLFLGWGVALFALIASLFMRNRLVIFNAAAMSALAMLLVDLLPMDPFIHPMPPVLSGTPWLAIHVPIIMVSYSVLTLGVLAAHMQVGVEIFRPKRQDLVTRMNDLLYWYMHVGSILLIAGILTGSIWAASSWGRYWGWDPKEVWSLVAFLAYMAILHGRFDRIIGPFGVAVASIAAFWAILMTYIGVNFVLSAGLHSYGFGESKVVSWMLLVGAVEVIFLSVGALAHGRRRRAEPPSSPGLAARA